MPKRKSDLSRNIRRARAIKLTRKKVSGKQARPLLTLAGDCRRAAEDRRNYSTQMKSRPTANTFIMEDVVRVKYTKEETVDYVDNFEEIYLNEAPTSSKSDDYLENTVKEDNTCMSQIQDDDCVQNVDHVMIKLEGNTPNNRIIPDCNNVNKRGIIQIVLVHPGEKSFECELCKKESETKSADEEQQHFLQYTESNPKTNKKRQKRCKLCSEEKNKRTCVTTVCDQCEGNPGFCIPCFKIFHL